jgi:hypothetical protein
VNPRRLVGAGVVLTLVGGAGALFVRHLDRTRPVTVGEAVERFRAASPTTTAAPTTSAAPSAEPSVSATSTAVPGTTAGPSASATTGPASKPATGTRTPSGVYVYDTTGYETADAGVHARHDYPAQTTVTVKDVPCGESVRWDATEDRWDDVTVCVSGGTSKVTAYVSFHRFYGQSEERDYTCGGDSWLRPPKGLERWTFDCTTDGGKAHTVATATTENGMLHVHYDTTLTGNSRGTNPEDFWLALDGPYVLRQASRVDADVDTPFGTITYHEEYDLRLTSRTPRR